METDLLFFLYGAVDQDEAAYAGYIAIEDSMSTDKYIGVVPTVVKLEYLSPLPLPIPPQLNGSGLTTDPPPTAVMISDRGAKLSLSPWTIGACVVTIFGAIISVSAWARNRRSRQRRHVQMMEDMSLMESTSRNPVSI
jgi:hypothetical protein